MHAPSDQLDIQKCTSTADFRQDFTHGQSPMNSPFSQCCFWRLQPAMTSASCQRAQARALSFQLGRKPMAVSCFQRTSILLVVSVRGAIFPNFSVGLAGKIESFSSQRSDCFATLMKQMPPPPHIPLRMAQMAHHMHAHLPQVSGCRQ